MSDRTIPLMPDGSYDYATLFRAGWPHRSYPPTIGYDLSEIREMIELYKGQEDILGIRAANAVARPPSDEQPDSDRHLPTDLEAMRYRGSPGMNDTFLGYLGSALGKGETVINAIETIVEAAGRNCIDDPARPHWRHDLAQKASWWLEKHPEWLSSALTAEQEDKWRAILDQGAQPRLFWQTHLGALAVGKPRGGATRYSKNPRPTDTGKNDQETANASQVSRHENRAKHPGIHAKPFVAFDVAALPPREWLYTESLKL